MDVTPPPTEGLDEASPEERLAEIARVRASHLFTPGGRLSDLFDYLIERSGPGEAPKEAEIALAVFGKRGGADLRDDPVARVYMHRLRRRLEEFYLRGGAPAGIRLEIPRGGYRITARRIAGVPTDGLVMSGFEPLPDGPRGALRADRTLDAPARRSFGLTRRAGLAAGLLLGAGVLIGCLMMALMVPQAGGRERLVRSAQAWKGLAASERGLLVVVGDYYIFGEYEDRLFLRRLIRDFSINSKDDLLARQLEDPRAYERYGDVALQYLPVSAAVALSDLSPLIARARSVEVALASELSPERLKSSDILYVGLLSGLGPLRDPVFTHSRFRIGASYDEILDRKTGETFTSEAFLATQGDTMYRDFGYFAAFDGPRGNRIAILAGTRDTALMGVAEMLTRSSGLKEIDAAIRGRKAFETLLEVRGQKHVNLETRILATDTLESEAIWSTAPSETVSFPTE
jgi:hypothetical protein